MTLSLAASIALGTFATVILAIASNRIHLTVAAMLGTVVLLVTGVLSARDVSETINPAEAMIALFFGGMVMATYANLDWTVRLSRCDRTALSARRR